MYTFGQAVSKITTDLRRSNLVEEAKSAINDAIQEAAKTRFYFNEMHYSFATVIGQEYYPDLGLVQLDAAWYNNGTSRYDVDVISQPDMDRQVNGSVAGGALLFLSRYGGQLRLYPVPSAVKTIYVDGFGKLTPSPLVNDEDTNSWLDEGSLYIIALAKRNILRDVVRDYGEARVLDGVADEYKAQLEQETLIKSSAGYIKATQF